MPACLVHPLHPLHAFPRSAVYWGLLGYFLPAFLRGAGDGSFLKAEMEGLKHDCCLKANQSSCEKSRWLSSAPLTHSLLHTNQESLNWMSFWCTALLSELLGLSSQVHCPVETSMGGHIGGG